MKILILANNDVGLYQFRRELIQELLKQNEVYIALPNGELIFLLEKMGCSFIEADVDRRGINPITDLKLIIRYFKILKSTKPELVITYTIKPNIYGGYLCQLLKIPYSVNITGLGTAFQKNGLLKGLVIKMYRIALRRAKDVFFENSENEQTFFDNKIVTHEQAYLLNGAGVNLEFYRSKGYPTIEQGQAVKFLFVGRVMKEKGVEELFSAMKRLVSEGVNCQLDMVGSCEENYELLIHQYEEEGWLHYYGYQKDVRPFIDQAHCFVLPSWHEGMANTNLECAAMERPVITTNIHGCLEAVIDGKSGYLCDKQSVASLYRALLKFLKLSDSERCQMGKEGRKHMIEMFDKSNIVRLTINRLGVN